MREIKFRAFIDGEMLGPDELAFEEYEPLADQLAGCENLMQFTGLKDKNGVEIYEGDILDFDEIEWGGKFRPEVVEISKLIGTFDLCGSLHDLSEWRQVIGNIHENPELLEESNEN